MAIEKHYHDRLIRGVEDENWNIIVALAKRRGQTIGEYLNDVAVQEWERETGQKVAVESDEAKG